MSVAARPALALDRGIRARVPALPSVGAIAAGIVLVVALRRAAQAAFPAEGLLVGAGFGIALLALAVGSGWRPAGPTGMARAWRTWSRVLRSVLAGAVVGLVLVAFAAATRTDAMPALRPVAPFVPWALVTTLVAVAEEIVLRGALFGATERLAGPAVAVVGTSLLFALIHVPFYGWSAVPLDLGVGLAFGGLRLWGRGLAAPVAAHVLADLATWWL